MPTDNPYLFVYGTLLDKENEFGAFLLENSTLITDARLRGKLYDLGEYPGAIVLEDVDDWVYGYVMLVNHPEETLKIIDQYEGFVNDSQQPDLFIRALVNVEAIDQTLRCWAYLYNHTVEGFRQITSGRFLKNAGL